MNVVCVSNDAFEDQLTARRVYQVEKWKGNSVMLVNDRDEIRWYGAGKFIPAGAVFPEGAT